MPAEECESVKEFATYFPKSKKHREIRFTNIMQRNRFHYDVSINNKSFGYLSEYGESRAYTRNAEGIMFFDFDGCDELVMKKKQNALHYYDKEFKEYEAMGRVAFEKYFGSYENILNAEIIGVGTNALESFLLKTLNSKGKYDFFIIRKTSKRIFDVIGDPFEIYKISEKSLKHIGTTITHPKFKTRFTETHKSVGGLLSLVRGFSIGNQNLSGEFQIKNLYNCININEELYAFYEFQGE